MKNPENSDESLSDDSCCTSTLSASSSSGEGGVDSYMRRKRLKILTKNAVPCPSVAEVAAASTNFSLLNYKSRRNQAVLNLSPSLRNEISLLHVNKIMEPKSKALAIFPRVSPLLSAQLHQDSDLQNTPLFPGDTSFRPHRHRGNPFSDGDSSPDKRMCTPKRMWAQNIDSQQAIFQRSMRDSNASPPSGLTRSRHENRTAGLICETSLVAGNDESIQTEGEGTQYNLEKNSDPDTISKHIRRKHKRLRKRLHRHAFFSNQKCPQKRSNQRYLCKLLCLQCKSAQQRVSHGSAADLLVFQAEAERRKMLSDDEFNERSVLRRNRSNEHRFFSTADKEAETKIVLLEAQLRLHQRNQLRQSRELQFLHRSYREYISNIADVIQIASSAKIDLLFDAEQETMRKMMTAEHLEPESIKKNNAVRQKELEKMVRIYQQREARVLNDCERQLYQETILDLRAEAQQLNYYLQTKCIQIVKNIVSAHIKQINCLDEELAQAKGRTTSARERIYAEDKCFTEAVEMGLVEQLREQLLAVCQHAQLSREEQSAMLRRTEERAAFITAQLKDENRALQRENEQLKKMLQRSVNEYADEKSNQRSERK